MKQATAHDVERVVNDHLLRHEFLRDLGAQVLPGTVQQDTWGWSVSVGTEKDPPRMYQFVDELVSVADEVRQDEQLEVLIAPSGIRPSEAS